jgi:hypothetical protein
VACSFIVLAFVVIAGGTVTAAASSNPGETLYPVKLASERVRVAITPSSIGKARLEAKFAERRIDELAYVVSKTKNGKEVEELSNQLSRHVEAMGQLLQLEQHKLIDYEAYRARPVPPPIRIDKYKTYLAARGRKPEDLKELRKKLKENCVKNEARLSEIESRVQRDARPGVRSAIQKSRQAYQKAIISIGEEK